MSGPRRRGSRRGGGGGQRSGAAPRALWREVELPEEPEPIRPATDPAALIRSLGSPPLRGQGGAAEHYLTAVVERAATVATALAASAGLLASADD